MNEQELRQLARNQLKVFSVLRSDPPAIFTEAGTNAVCSLCSEPIQDADARGYRSTAATYWYHGKCHEILEDCRHEGERT